jgi:Flp pilus assembly pilin Flp
MRPPSGESGRGSLIDFALILILFSIVLVVVLVLLGPAITDFLGRLVSRS